MKLHSLLFRGSLLFFAMILSFLTGAERAAAQSAAQSQAPVVQAPVVPARITQAIDETQLVRLKGNVHPLARPEFDQGAVPASLPMQRMLLVLKRSAEQQAALDQLMLDLHNSNSPNYHKWLTPEQFGAQFGPADADIQAVSSWLQAQGFQMAKVSKGKLAIEFSGTAAQVKEAFHTEIRQFAVKGEQHLANASDPQIPAAFMPVIHGLAPLNSFHSKPMHRVIGEFMKSTPTSEIKSANPEFTTSGGNYALGPTDFATIYNVLPLWNAATPIDGTGQSIAVVGVSNINLQDVADFRTLFGLSTGGAAVPQVIIDGADPGIVSSSETEALLDTEWSGAVAKGAQIHLVIAADTDIADGLVLAIFHVIDNNSDPILSVSFGNCESALGASGNSLFQSLWEQAAAQGISVTVASGDNGSAGCENQNANAPNPATTGLQVSGFASTPFNVAVGGTDFDDVGAQSTYFKPNSQNDPNTLASAIGFIPETTWNLSCTNSAFNAITGLTTAEANCNSTNAQAKAAVFTVGASGGKSGTYTKPAYQNFISAANGMPADGARDLPDVSLFASTGSTGAPPNITELSRSFYVVCEADRVTSGVSCNKSGPFSFLGVGGTSASTPSFAGILALVNQSTGQRQGNANFVLYKLAQQQFQAGTACTSAANPLPNGGCAFYDITTGTIAMPCAKGSSNCTTTGASDTIGVLSGYNATAGYDLATGIGSVNANNLVTKWASAATTFTPTATTLSISPLNPTAGTNVTVNIVVSGAGGTPSGDVALTSTAANGQGVDGFTLDGTGKVVNKTTNQLTGGSYQVTARYGGDGTFAPSLSNAVTVTVSKASSTTTASVLKCTLPMTPTSTCTSFMSGPSTTLVLQAAINPSGVLLPTGTVSFFDNGSATAVATTSVNAASEAFTAGGIATFAAGNHSIVAKYSGDPSFNASNSAAVTFTITTTGVATTTTVTSSATSIKSGGSVTLTATVTGTGTGASPTGTVQFMNGTAALGTAQACTAVSGASSPTCKATLMTTLAFLTPPSPPNRIPTIRLQPLGILAFVLLVLFLIGLKRIPAPYRRGYACAGLLLLVGLMAGLVGCNGGYGGGGGTLHYDTITGVYSGDSTYAGSTSPGITITIQ
jgi:subtilase family serine protease